MEGLCTYQNELIENIKRAEKNFKKSPKERITSSYIETRLETLEHLFMEFKDGHKMIISESPKDKKDQYLRTYDYEEFEELYTQYKSVLREHLQRLVSVNTSIPQMSGSDNKSGEVKLPRIQLPVFTGKYEEWQTFYDMFLSLIHDNKSLSGVQKLHYLKGNLSGEPLNLLCNFSTTGANYEEAWTLLVRRYNNKRYNTNAVMRILFTQKKVQSESASAIKQLLDTTSTCLKSLQNMEINISNWDPVITYLVASKLDVESIKQWENKLNMVNDTLPTWTELRDYLEYRFRSLEMIDSNVTRAAPTPKPVSKPKVFHSAVETGRLKQKASKCAMCREPHYLQYCKRFEQLSARERQEFVQNNHLCFNCLSSTHAVINCRLSTSCKKCGKRHNTLLHFDKENKQELQSSSEATTSTSAPSESTIAKPMQSTSRGDPTITAAFSREEIHPAGVLLATAVVKVMKNNGCKLNIRSLLDQGSQASFITEASVQLLGLTRKPVSGWVSGLGDGRTKIKHMVTFDIESRTKPDVKVRVNAYVLHSLTSLLPSTRISCPEWMEIKNLSLADPSYASPGKIDVLLGAEVYGEILLDGMIKSSQCNLIAQNTALGWILSGRVSEEKGVLLNDNLVSMHVHMREDELLKQFWELENEPNMIQKELTKSEKTCEEFFDTTTMRDREGRFIVRLPFATENPQCLQGHSREIAIKRLEILERKLAKNPNLRREYNLVMKEYLELNHMVLVEDADINNPRALYLPYHAIVREDKNTTKVRIVFDASCKGDNNVSLNDDLLVGPKLQQDLRHILMRWRRHEIGIVADIVKMYRMVKVAEDDTNFQRIVWRFDATEPIMHYKLLRLTFGTACAPYLAVKSLQRLAELEEHKYPIAAKITKEDYYMDDLMTGAATHTEALEIYNQMTGLMHAGGFQMQKWNSNSDVFLQQIKKEDHVEEKSKPIAFNNLIKVLGISWNRETDNFEYMLNLPEPNECVTKRQVLSDVAKLYDPLGWIAPVIITAKVFIQKLWKSGLGWDDQLTEELLQQWLEYRDNLFHLKEFQLPRWMNVTRSSKVELHGYSDASRIAFAATIYIRIIDEFSNVYVRLVTAKTKVAPIDKEISIPRLELCGAVLAAKLLFEVAQVLNVPKENLYGWSDSTIVLAWIKGGSSRWSTFVSNRVSTITNIIEFEQWGHVNTHENPADCASRGLQPEELVNYELWWHGPQWLANHTVHIDTSSVSDTQEEQRVQSLTVLSDVNEESVWSKYSSLAKMLMCVVSYCRRVLYLRTPKGERPQLPKYITLEELNQALLICIKQVQNQEYSSEIKQLKNASCVQKKSNLRTLCPILDANGIIRVGGRITQSNVNYDTKHPIIMPGKNYLTRLLVLDAHERTLHGGPGLMLNCLRSKYWIIRVKNLVKMIYRQCAVCSRYSNKKSTQIMGLLPEVRLKPSKPFKATGVDYCGPINVRFSPGRGSKAFKGYICLFICMVTRAVHLEAVTDLTAKGFIAAFRRFTSRRGHCQDLYSDNGTNFVGADKQLREMFNNAKSSIPAEIAELLTLESTNWHFIPPHSPNFGGLWEAGVRSTKTHLRKVVGSSTLTYEELSTVLTQVEACLNSRPISLLSDDPNYPLPLTPGHFLVGEPLINIADEDYTKYNVTGLDRWRLTQKMVNDFWNRWYKEYLVTLNNRYKWNTKTTEPEINDIVIVKDDNIPAAKWILGKIIKKHPGPDNVTRVVTIKCKNGELKRPLSKLCLITK